MEFVKIAHPKIETLGECPVSALPHWESYGWSRVEPEPPVAVEMPEPVVDVKSTQPATPRASRRAATNEE